MNFITLLQTMISIKNFLAFWEQFSLTASGGLYFVAHKNTWFWKCLQNLSWRMKHFLKMNGNLWKVLADCNFSKNAALLQVFFKNLSYVLRTHFFSKMSANDSSCKCNCCITPIWTLWTLMVYVKKNSVSALTQIRVH